MKNAVFILFMCFLNATVMAQDNTSHVFFANQSRLPIHLEVSILGNNDITSINKTQFLPFEITHDHISTISIGDFISVNEKDHNENNSTLKFSRLRNFGDNSFDASIEVKANDDLLFTILIHTEDNSGLFTKTFYNIQYPDNSFELTAPGLLLKDDAGTQSQIAAHSIRFDNEDYKLVFGVFDEKADNTDNIIFSMSNLIDTIYRYDPPISDTLQPNILNVLTYNPGILMPLNISDQDEDERAEVLHKAMPKNMDIIVFEEFFEPQKVQQILDSLHPWYPYHTGKHNKILVPLVGKEGGVRIVSKYPILEEDEISFSENGCIPTEFFSLFANKGVKYAKIDKKGQIIHVFGTHTSIQPCDLYIMGQFMASKHIPKNEVVIMAGDFNVDMNRLKNGSDDYSILLDTINALEPTYLSFLNDWTYTGTSSGLNHMYCCNPNGRQQLDYIFASSQHKIPSLLTNRSLQARLNEPDVSFGIFDMGDHEPVYARMEFPAITSLEYDSTACMGQSIELSTQSVQAAKDGKYQWYKNGVALPNAQNESIIIPIEKSDDFGKYTCKYSYTYMPDTVINNFYDSSYMDYTWYFRGATEGEINLEFNITPKDSSENCSGIPTNIYTRLWNQLLLFPNPAKNSIRLEGEILQVLDKIELIDNQGKIIKSFPSETFGNSLEINLFGLASGIYFIHSYDDTGQTFKKSFIKIQ